MPGPIPNVSYVKPFYEGPCKISGFDKNVSLPAVRLFETLDTDAEGKYRVRHWRGTARVPGMIYGLLDLLGGHVYLILPDGRTAECMATGWSEDSAWVIELEGIGEPPR